MPSFSYIISVMITNKNNKVIKSKLPRAKYAAVALLLPVLFFLPLGFHSADYSAIPPNAVEAQSLPTLTDAAIKPVDPIPADYFDFSRSADYLQYPEMKTEETSADQINDLVSADDLYYSISAIGFAPAQLIFLAADYTLYVSASQLNLRSDPSMEAETIAKLKFGEKVTCEGENEQWMRVRHDGVLGFLKTEYTSRTMVFQPVKEKMFVKPSSLNLRAAPSADAEILDKLAKGDYLTRIGIGDEWSQVVTTAGLTGFVASEYLTKQPPAPKNTIIYSRADYSKLTQDEINLLTKIVALEGHPKYGYDGYLAIVTVILNRVESSRFPNTIRGVVSQPHQFSVYTTTRDPVYNADVRNAVKDALAGKRSLEDYVLYFIVDSDYEKNALNGGAFGSLKIYKIAYGTAWCYKTSDR